MRVFVTTGALGLTCILLLFHTIEVCICHSMVVTTFATVSAVEPNVRVGLAARPRLRQDLLCICLPLC